MDEDESNKYYKLIMYRLDGDNPVFEKIWWSESSFTEGTDTILSSGTVYYSEIKESQDNTYFFEKTAQVKFPITREKDKGYIYFEKVNDQKYYWDIKKEFKITDRSKVIREKLDSLKESIQKLKLMVGGGPNGRNRQKRFDAKARQSNSGENLDYKEAQKKAQKRADEKTAIQNQIRIEQQDREAEKANKGKKYSEQRELFKLATANQQKIQREAIEKKAKDERIKQEENNRILREQEEKTRIEKEEQERKIQEMDQLKKKIHDSQYTKREEEAAAIERLKSTDPFIDMLFNFTELFREIILSPIFFKLNSLTVENLRELKTSYALAAIINFLYVDIEEYRDETEDNQFIGLIVNEDDDLLKNDHYNYEKLMNIPESESINFLRYIHIMRIIERIELFIGTKENWENLRPQWNQALKNREMFEDVLTKLIETKTANLESIISELTTLSNDAAFKQKLTEKIKKQNIDKILTYVKISQFTPKTNQRFKVILNKNQLSEENENSLLVKYNADNFPYYKIDFSASDKVIQNNNNNKFTIEPSRKEITSVTYDQQYLLGKFNKVFNSNEKNQKIAQHLFDEFYKDRTDYKPFIMLGYGASGSGKTSSLIYLSDQSVIMDNQSDREGIIIKLCNILGGNGFKKITAKTDEYFLNHLKPDDPKPIQGGAPIIFTYRGGQFVSDKTNLNLQYIHQYREQMQYLIGTKVIVTDGDTQYEAVIENPVFNKHDDDGDEIGNELPLSYIVRYQDEIRKNTKVSTTNLKLNLKTLSDVLIFLIDRDRFVKATTNNPTSSRSHSITYLKIEKQQQQDDVPIEIILCDLAGIENKFECENVDVINKFLNIKLKGSEIPYYLTERGKNGKLTDNDPVTTNTDGDNADYLKLPLFDFESFKNIAKEIKTDIEEVALANSNAVKEAKKSKNDPPAPKQPIKIKGLYRNPIFEAFVDAKDEDNYFYNDNDIVFVIEKFLNSFLTVNTVSNEDFYKFVTEKKDSKDPVKNAFNLIESTNTNLIGSQGIRQLISYSKIVNNLADAIKDYFGHNIQAPATAPATALDEDRSKIKLLIDKLTSIQSKQKSVQRGMIEQGGTQLLNSYYEKEPDSSNHLDIDDKYVHLRQPYKDVLGTNDATIMQKSFVHTTIIKTYQIEIETIRNTPKTLGKDVNGNLLGKDVNGNFKICTIKDINYYVTDWDKWEQSKRDLNEYIKQLNAYNSGSRRDKEFSLNIINFYIFLQKLKVYCTIKTNDADESEKYTPNLSNEALFNSLVSKFKHEKESEYKGFLTNGWLDANFPTTYQSLKDKLKELEETKIKIFSIPEYYNNMAGPIPLFPVEYELYLKEYIVKLFKPFENVDDEWKKYLKQKKFYYAMRDNFLQAMSEGKVVNFLRSTTNIANNIKKMLEYTKKKLDYGLKICSHRLTEGVYINKSLEDIRDTIRQMLIVKSENIVFNSPNYIDICLDTYCPTHKNCFEMKTTDNLTILSEIFKSIFNYLYPNGDDSEKKAIETFYKNILVSVFCFLNISIDSNDPPPVPYIDINRLKMNWYSGNDILKDLIITYDLITTAPPNGFSDKIVMPVNILGSIKGILDSYAGASVPLSLKIDTYKKSDSTIPENIEKFIEIIDNNNAASAIGTLEFIDRISKFNSINNICFINDNENLPKPDEGGDFVDNYLKAQGFDD